MKNNKRPKSPKKIIKKKVDLRILKSALIMSLGSKQIEMIKSQPFKNASLKSFEITKQILQMAESIQSVFSQKTKYLERINKKL